MPTRLVSAALPLRTVTRSGTFTAPRHANPPRAEPVNGNTTNFATLNNITTNSLTQVLSSPTSILVKSLSHQIQTSAPASFSPSCPMDVSPKGLMKGRNSDKLRTTLLSGEQHGKVARAWEPVERELWLERFGGPGKTIEKSPGNGTVLLREVGPDGKGYLRVLI